MWNQRSRPSTAASAWAILVGAFLAWMFAGLEISLFVLIHRQMTMVCSVPIQRKRS